MADTQNKHAIGVFSNRTTAEQALKELKDTGFPMNKLSVLTKDFTNDEKLSSENLSELTLTRSEGVASGAAKGAATGGLLALAGGIAALLIPGIGLPLVAGSVLTVLLGSGAVAGIGGLIGALEGWYIPEKQAKLYNDRVSQGDYLVILEGAESEIHQAEKILSRWGIQEWQIFAPPTV
ncbi:hypothetical protein C7Y66_11850 [Chroococcidiopsis sp. CCALA 051]|uniref:hypothetical protein n=1 Tax=Chroococcidiopsis sp. CCALA 051 TaxID=869949 RepID=UPI000D0D484E|nr:hypothetical protein [Chroococcidiopsis sp. CCALA 051]MBE9014587.1 hypothetical protein [Chroococcidiopsidales cyanobacterium LEGE 13417]PSM48946.1 hypothetical protein C7Y66_11850 [Chroococcidiopsis sp. CCALA 051]